MVRHPRQNPQAVSSRIRRQPKTRQEVEAMLHELAYVLHLSRRIRAEMEIEIEAELSETPSPRG